MFDEGALRAKYEAMGLDEDDIEVLIAKKRKAAEATNQTQQIIKADRDMATMKDNIANEAHDTLQQLSGGRKTSEGQIYAKAGKTSANIIREATEEEKKAGADQGTGLKIVRRVDAKPIYTFGDDYNPDTDTDKFRKAAYARDVKYKNMLDPLYKQRDEISGKLKTKGISDREKDALNAQYTELNNNIKELQRQQYEAGKVELTDEDLAARQRARDIAAVGLDMDSGADTQYQALIDSQGETAAAKKNKAARAFRENVESLRDLEGNDLSIPFDNNAHVSVRMTNLDKERGLFPISVTSNGRSQTFAIPFGSLNKFKNRLNDWSHGDMSVSFITDSNDEKSDNNERLRDAWRTGDYSRTNIPEKLFGLKKGQGRGSEAYYGYNIGGMSQMFNLNSDYYNNPEAFKKEFAKDIQEAELRGQTLPQYYEYLAGVAAENRRNRLKEMQQGIVNTFDQKTGLSNDIDASRKAALDYLSDISQHAKRENTRINAAAAYNTLKNIASGVPLTDEQNEALEKLRRKAVDDIRSDIRWGMKHENEKQRDAAIELMNTIREMQQYANNIENAEDLSEKIGNINMLPDTIRVTADGTILGLDMANDWVPAGDISELFGDDYLSQLPLDTLEDLDTIELTRGDNGAFTYDDGVMPAVTLAVPEAYDPELVQAWQDAYDELGGPEAYRAYAQFLNTDLDKLFHGRMSELPRELRFVDVLDDEGNPVLDANGNPVRRPYIFMSGSRAQLEDLYGEKNVGSRKRNWRSKFTNKDGEIDMNKYLAWQNARIARWLQGESGAQFADRIAAIQDNLRAGGLTPEQRERNRAILSKQAAARRKARLEADSRAKLAAASALRRQYARFMGSLLAPDEGVEDTRPDALRELNLPVSKLRDIYPFGMYQRINAGKDDRDAKALAELLARLSESGRV